MADNDQNIEIWKVKKLIKGLEAARGNGTSMISLILPPKDQVRSAVFERLRALLNSEDRHNPN